MQKHSTNFMRYFNNHMHPIRAKIISYKYVLLFYYFYVMYRLKVALSSYIPMIFLPLFQQIIFETARCANLIALFFNFTFFTCFDHSRVYTCLYTIHIYAVGFNSLIFTMSRILCVQLYSRCFTTI